MYEFAVAALLLFPLLFLWFLHNSPNLGCDISNFGAFSENIDAISATSTCFDKVAKSISCEKLWNLWERATLCHLGISERDIVA